MSKTFKEFLDDDDEFEIKAYKKNEKWKKLNRHKREIIDNENRQKDSNTNRH
jgi:hypothetical protein